MIKLALTFINLLLAVSAFSQSELSLHGKVYDFKTRIELAGATVQLLTKDSTVIETVTASRRDYATDANGEVIHESYTADFTLHVPHAPASYILKVSHVGYKTNYVDYTIGSLKKKEFARELPKILLKAESKVLNEVSVVGSKVVFYHKGDTIVYNADAFVLSEGSMLDALIKQMPGVELRKDGKIYHNGRFVESLLLNGKDFFKGNQQMMLDNLPAYTVKQVKVYDKQSEQSEFFGYDMGSKKYVMDVSLKKEYSIGWITNTEAGGGSSDRYMARLFAMRYTDHSRLTVYGNINNLNDTRKPGQDSNFTPETMPKGDNKEKRAGIDYDISSRNGKYQLYGNAMVSHSDLYTAQEINRVNFLNTGDTYDYEFTKGRDKRLSLSTYNRFTLKPWEKVQIYLTPSLTYNKFDTSTNYLLGSFDEMMGGMSSEILDNLYSPTASGDIRKHLINRYKKEGLGDGHDLSEKLEGRVLINLGNNHGLQLEANVSNQTREEDRFNRYSINYKEEDANAQSGNQYYKDEPDRLTSFLLGATHNYRLSRSWSYSLGYSFEHKYKRKNSSLFLLDEADEMDGLRLGELPSVTEYESLIDHDYSYRSRQTDNTHTITPGIYYRKNKLSFQVRFPIAFIRQHLDYQRGNVDTTITRNSSRIPIENLMLEWASKDNSWKLGLHVETREDTPDMTYMVMNDKSDPLNIRLGNPDLKNTKFYLVQWYVDRNLREKNIMNHLIFSIFSYPDAISMGYLYDVNTGVRTYRPYNVDGNWSGKVSFGHSRPLDKAKKLLLSSYTTYEYLKNVDLIGGSTDAYAQPERSVVKTNSLSEELRINYTLGKSTIGLKGKLAWKHIGSERDDFSSFNPLDLQYGATATVSLPWHLQLSTDLTMYSRRGYEGSAMNTNDLVWNARLSFTMLKGSLTWMLDGFDILNQLNNVTRVVNAQGRTETFTNALPRYALLHVAYKFHAKPKKK